jgi:hypothetical protein
MMPGPSWRGWLASGRDAIGWERLLKLPLPRHPLRLPDLGGCHHPGQGLTGFRGLLTDIFSINPQTPRDPLCVRRLAGEEATRHRHNL